MRVDAKGFYLCWVDQNNEIDLLDIAIIRDVRTGQYAKRPRVSYTNKSIVYIFQEMQPMALHLSKCNIWFEVCNTLAHLVTQFIINDRRRRKYINRAAICPV